MQQECFYEIGERAQIDEGVVLGYRYPGDTHPTCIGDDAIIRSGSIIYADTIIGNRFSCGHQVLIRAKVTIGNRVVIHHKTTLEGQIRIGSGVKIMAGVYIPSEIVIGDMVFIGPGVTILNDKRPMRGETQISGVIIEDHVTIGGNATVCPGITIGARSFVAAGAVVTKDVPPDTLASGVPARFQPLPESLAGGNYPDSLLPQTDLWGTQEDLSWRVDFPEFIAKGKRLVRNQGHNGLLTNRKDNAEE